MASRVFYKPHAPPAHREITLSQEPAPPDYPLLTLDNVLVTPHMATASRDAMIKKARSFYDNFRRVIRGEMPLNVVRPYRVIEAEAGVVSG